ncbi:MAG TPA: hypothetical protein VHM19_16850, partial [Polyangiales bacterium]|nr:hypothetical protein [Polyangiales bacterium]
ADGVYTSDPSHPAFYLAGQELGTSNHRAFTALDPCKADGEGCETGIDCCGGFCTDSVCAEPKSEEPRCSQNDEACKTKSDCCDERALCISGYCGAVVVVE